MFQNETLRVSALRLGHRTLRALLLGFLLITSVLVAAPSRAYEIMPTISPSITAQPIQLVFWIFPTVAPENESHVIADTLAAAALWDNVPTACISFTMGRIVHTNVRPSVSSQELLVVVANAGDPAAYGGGSPPANGNPGSWEGAAANAPGINLVIVGAHELGHAIGLNHSSMGKGYSYAMPIMNFSTSGVAPTLTQDDIAAVSLAYPCSSQPLSAVTGSVTGRFLTSNGTPASGVNVTAVEVTQNKPMVARLSGQSEEADGAFTLNGLPPGTYRLDYRDGNSYDGMRTLVETPADGQTFNGQRGGFQVDNFADFSSAQFTIAAGQTVNMGDVPISIWEMSLDSPSTLSSGWLPAAGIQSYNVKLRVRGGLRDLSLWTSGLPMGLSARIVSDNNYPLGRQYIEVSGTTMRTELRTVNFVLFDRAGVQKSLLYNIAVGNPAPGLVARYSFVGSGADSSFHGYDATVVNGTYVSDHLGHPASAVSLDGVSSYIQLPNEQAFDLNEYTVIVLGKIPSGGWKDQWLVTKGSKEFGNFGLRRMQYFDGYALYGYDTFDSSFVQVGAAAPIPADTFFCAAVAVDATSADMYLDGQLESSAPNPPPMRFNDEPVRIGLGGYSSPNTYLKAIIDEVVVYRGKLNAAGIQPYCQ